jgi:hypothetical protein
MIIPGLLGEATFWSPLIVLAILAIFEPSYWAAFAAVWSFWVLLLPAVPIQLAFIAFYAKLFSFLKGKNTKKENATSLLRV